MEDVPKPIDTGRRRVYDADAMDAYIRHLHERIAALHAQLRDGIPEEAPATPDGGRTAKAPRPTWRSLLGRARHLAPVAPRPHRDEDQRYPWLDEEDADRPVPTGADVEAQFWSRSNRLAAAEDPSSIGDLGPGADGPRRGG